MSNPFFQFGMIGAVVIALGIGLFERPDLRPDLLSDLGDRLDFSAPREKPVLVFTIPDVVRLAAIRAAIDPARILEETEFGVALEGGRIYTADMAGASALINAAKWVERPIQIVSLGMDQESADGGEASAAALSPADREARIRELVKKPTLTRGEQQLVLQAMNDGMAL